MHYYSRKSATHCHSDRTYYIIFYTLYICEDPWFSMEKGYGKSWKRTNLLIYLLSVNFPGLKVGKVTWNLAGKPLNSSVLDVYSETRQTSRVPCYLFSSRMAWAISLILWLIASPCLSIAVMCGASMSLISDFIPWIIVSYSICKASPCFSRAVVNF